MDCGIIHWTRKDQIGRPPGEGEDAKFYLILSPTCLLREPSGNVRWIYEFLTPGGARNQNLRNRYMMKVIGWDQIAKEIM